MRGTTDRGAFERFVTAVRGFPPSPRNGASAQAVYEASYTILRELAEAKPPFPRAMAWRAYALTVSVSEGWSLKAFADEAALAPTGRLDLALRLALEAVKLDPTDYDLWWALANVHLVRREPEEARAAYDEALYLNQDEANPNLFAEAADAMIHLGLLSRADGLIRRARIDPDWYHWVAAWKQFMTARRNPESEYDLLSLAQEELDRTRGRPGRSLYLVDIQLLYGAIHARKAAYLDQGGKEPVNAPFEPDAPTLARAERMRARRAVDEFRASFPDWNVEQALAYAPFADPADIAYWRESVEMAWQA